MEGKNESRFTKSAQFVGDPVHLLNVNSSDEPNDFPSAKGIRYWHDTCSMKSGKIAEDNTNGGSYR